MSIVLAILKWLGILAGGIVGLLLLLTALILFVPVRYRAEGTRDGGIRFGFSLSWLLRLVMIKKRPDSGVIRLYLFGIPVRRLAGDSAEKAASEASGQDGKKSHGEPERKYSASAGKKKTEKGTENAPAHSAEKSGEQGKKPRVRSKGRKTRGAKKERGKKSFSFSRVSSIIGLIREAENRLLVRRLWRELWLLLRYLSPCKLRGEIIIGTGDPSSTGLLIGGISLLPFAYQKGVRICPDFENRLLEAVGYVKGRIRVLYLLRLALRIYRDRELRQLWREINKSNVKKKEAA